MSLQLYIYVVVMSISFLLSSVLFFKRTTPIYIKGFTPFLLFSILVELSAAWFIRNDKLTTVLYNISTTLEIVFYLWVLLNIINKNSIKKIVIISIFIYPVLSFVDIYFIQKNNIFHSTSYSLGCLLLVIFSIAYFFQLFAKPTATTLVNESAFWICTGLLLFYSVSFPLFASVNFMGSFPPILSKNVQIILILLNVFLYLLFSIAFLCRIRIKKS